jgi:hypothetical protein
LYASVVGVGGGAGARTGVYATSLSAEGLVPRLMVLKRRVQGRGSPVMRDWKLGMLMAGDTACLLTLTMISPAETPSLAA